MKQLSERKEEAESDENRRKQGKIFRSLLAVLMLTAMLVTSVLQSVFAGDYVAGTKGNLTLTVQQADEEGNQTPLPGVGLTIYRVGSVNFDGNVHFVLDEALAAAAIDFDSITTADGWYEAAGQLADMISSGSVDVWGLSRISDAEGNIIVTDLAEGMYLVVQTDANSSVAVSPMLISVPLQIRSRVGCMMCRHIRRLQRNSIHRSRLRRESIMLMRTTM